MLYVEVHEHYGTILDAAHRLYTALLTARNRDQERDEVLYRHCLAGKSAECAAAVALGLPPAVILEDSPGSPDLTTDRWAYDVKAAPVGADAVNVRADVLHHDRLIIACRPAGHYRQAVLGWCPTAYARRLPVQPPARGHGKPYVSIPLSAFYPFSEATMRHPVPLPALEARGRAAAGS